MGRWLDRLRAARESEARKASIPPPVRRSLDDTDDIRHTVSPVAEALPRPTSDARRALSSEQRDGSNHAAPANGATDITEQRRLLGMVRNPSGPV